MRTWGQRLGRQGFGRFLGPSAGVAVTLALAYGAGTGVSGAHVPALRHKDRTSTTHRPVRRPERSGGRTGTRGTLAPLREPTARRPLRILVVGDSLGEDLQFGLADLLSGQPGIRLSEDAVGDTGLADRAYYDWPVHLAQDLHRTRPNLTVVLLGGNDAVSFDQGGRYVGFGTPLWRRDYGNRVRQMMVEATRAGAHVVWVGLPIMAKTSVLANRDMEELNAVYSRTAAKVPGAQFLSSWNVFQRPGGGFAEFLRTRSGQVEQVRDSDGVHIAPVAGDELIASYVIDGIDRRDGLHLCPSPTDPWRRYDPPGCHGSPT